MTGENWQAPGADPVTGEDWPPDERPPSTGCSWLLFAVVLLLFLLLLSGVTVVGLVFWGAAVLRPEW